MRYEATFEPQAWVDDNAVPVNPLGKTTWDCTEFVLHPPAWCKDCFGDEFRQELDVEGESVDYNDLLKNDPAAPAWIRDWEGPFTITVRATASTTTAGEQTDSDHIKKTVGEAVQYGIYDTVQRRLSEVGDYTDLDMGSLNTYDGPILMHRPFTSNDGDLTECWSVERGRYRVVKVQVTVLEVLGDLVDALNCDDTDNE